MTRFSAPPKVAAVIAGVVLALVACSSGGGNAFKSGSSSSSSGGSVVVGGADFTEMHIMEAMYSQLLTKAGYSVQVKTAGTREIYAKSLIAGDIGVVPDYAATMAEYLNTAANGPTAKAISSSDAAATVAAMQPLAAKDGLKVLEPSKALDANGFYVTKAFASKNNLKTLSDLAKLNLPITIAAGDECNDPNRIFCAPGLRKTYGLNIVGVTGDAFGSASGKQKVVAGQAQLGETGTTDGTLAALGLVLLQDDKKLQAADNLVPIVNTKVAGDPKIASTLNKLASVLTTEDLAQLNLKVDGERQKPDDVAKAYLQSKGLL